MKKALYIWILLISTGANAQEKIKNIYPTLGYTPDISVNAGENLKRLKAAYLKIDSLVQSYDSFQEAEEHLTDTQLEIYENEEEYSKEDHLYVGSWGCSWYCGGGPDSIFASTHLDSTSNYTYTAENIHDFSLRTAWVEGSKSNGIGESITFRFHQKSAPVTTIQIFNGYMKSPLTWQNNSRVKRFKLYLNDNLIAYLNLEDTKAQQTFKIDTIYEEHQNTFLKLEISAIYPGNKYQDVAVSEIEFDGFGVHCFPKGSLVSNQDSAIYIENLQTGDSILTYNLEKNQFETRAITSCVGSKHHNLYKIKFDGGFISVTDDHPLKTAKGYKSIKKNNKYGILTSKLNTGDTIFHLNNSKKITQVIVQKIEKINSCEIAYDLTLENKQNEIIYFVNSVGVGSENFKKK